MKILAVCTVKNEAAFILEWLAWNRLIGFTDFMMFQNGSTDGTKELLQLLADHDLIHYQDNDGARYKSPQRYSYRCASRSEQYRYADWAMAIDIDEFVRINVPGGTLPDLIAAYPEDVEEIRLVWRVFGCAGHKEMSDDLVTSRFDATLPEQFARRLQMPTKTLFKTASFSRFGVHLPKEHLFETWNSYTGSGNRTDPSQLNIFAINDAEGGTLGSVHHYIVKDIQNYILKCDRGKSGHPGREMDLPYWKIWNAKGQRDETFRGKSEMIRDEIERIDRICGGEALKLHRAAVEWRAKRYAELVKEPKYARVLSDILAYEYGATGLNFVTDLVVAEV